MLVVGFDEDATVRGFSGPARSLREARKMEFPRIRSLPGRLWDKLPQLLRVAFTLSTLYTYEWLIGISITTIVQGSTVSHQLDIHRKRDYCPPGRCIYLLMHA